ncbi:MBOAT, membrane-bound O-acyltransferase family-domain-containing protein [Dipodascopsis uninucleata]
MSCSETSADSIKDVNDGSVRSYSTGRAEIATSGLQERRILAGKKSDSEAEVENENADSCEDAYDVTEVQITNSIGSKNPNNTTHIYPIHSVSRSSILSRDSTTPTPSFVGFRNLTIIVLAVSNLRLVIENFIKYGVLIRFSQSGISKKDICFGILLTGIIPLHLFVAIIIEKAAAAPVMGYILRAQKNRENKSKAKQEELGKSQTIVEALKPRPKHLWRFIVFLHSVNSITCLVLTTIVVYFHIYNPLVGTLCELHAVIVCLKVASYALTNRDLREGLLHSEKPPEIYASATYPRNLTFSNLTYFWWAPTLVYQPVYPRSPAFRPVFFVKRMLEIIGSMFCIWLLSAQYAVPILEHSLIHFHSLHFVGIAERLFKLATVSMAIWLIGFFCFFQSALNALAEVMRFGDREFYEAWWNSRSVGEYWKLWNKPVTNYFRRHIYVPLVRRGWKPATASVMVFFVSAVLHELLVGIPTHNIIGVAFTSMILQIPLIQATAPLEHMNGGGIVGNYIFWLSFFIGQPLGVLLYYFAWNVKSGSIKNL